MKNKLISDKQQEILKFPYYEDYDAIICDGAIRSGKTIWCSISFVLWAMANFNECNFAICGKTIGSAIRNIIKPLRKVKYIQKEFNIHFSSKESLLTIRRNNKVNYFYVFGGKDESSYELIQGITLAGIMFDEVALQPKSFVDQGTGRCSEEGSKFFFNCNPRHPTHWFKQEWIDNAINQKAYYLHFTMDDNPSLSEKIKSRYRSLYSGVFYKRYIEGKWVAAEGVIYELFVNNENDYIIDSIPDDEQIISLNTGVDFGGSKSSTAFVTIGIGKNYKYFYILESKKIDSNILNTDTLKSEFAKYIKGVTLKYSGIVHNVFCDNAEPLHIRDLQNTQIEQRLNCRVGNAIKEEIIYRIEAFNTLFAQKRLRILRHNKEVIQSFKDAVWDEKHSTTQKDVRLDDGSYCVDLLDASEYAIERNIKTIYQTGGMS